MESAGTRDLATLNPVGGNGGGRSERSLAAEMLVRRQAVSPPTRHMMADLRKMLLKCFPKKGLVLEQVATEFAKRYPDYPYIRPNYYGYRTLLDMLRDDEFRKYVTVRKVGNLLVWKVKGNQDIGYAYPTMRKRKAEAVKMQLVAADNAWAKQERKVLGPRVDFKRRSMSPPIVYDYNHVSNTPISTPATAELELGGGSAKEQNKPPGNSLVLHTPHERTAPPKFGSPSPGLYIQEHQIVVDMAQLRTSIVIVGNRCGQQAAIYPPAPIRDQAAVQATPEKENGTTPDKHPAAQGMVTSQKGAENRATPDKHAAAQGTATPEKGAENGTTHDKHPTAQGMATPEKGTENGATSRNSPGSHGAGDRAISDKRPSAQVMTHKGAQDTTTSDKRPASTQGYKETSASQERDPLRHIRKRTRTRSRSDSVSRNRDRKRSARGPMYVQGGEFREILKRRERDWRDGCLRSKLEALRLMQSVYGIALPLEVEKINPYMLHITGLPMDLNWEYIEKRFPHGDVGSFRPVINSNSLYYGLKYANILFRHRADAIKDFENYVKPDESKCEGNIYFGRHESRRCIAA